MAGKRKRSLGEEKSGIHVGGQLLYPCSCTKCNGSLQTSSTKSRHKANPATKQTSSTILMSRDSDESDCSSDSDESDSDESDDEYSDCSDSDSDEREDESETSEDESEDEVDERKELSEADKMWQASRKICREILEQVASGLVSISGAVAISKIYAQKLEPFTNMQLPTSEYGMTNLAEFDETMGELLDLCWKCDYVYEDNVRITCPECPGNVQRTPPGRKRKRQMLIFDIVKRMQMAFAQPAIAPLLRSPLTREKGDGDTWDAGLLKGKTRAEMLAQQCLGMHTDGTVLDSGKQRSFTPVVFQWFQLPPGIRQSFGGLLLYAVFPPKVLSLALF